MIVDHGKHDSDTCRLCTDGLGVSPAELSILLHALGVQKRGRQWTKGGWRNHFSTGPDTDTFAPCKRLESGGWMTSHVGQSYDGEVWTFRVTQAGIAALRLARWPIALEAAPSESEAKP